VAKAARLVLPASGPGNERHFGSLSLNQAAAALVALINGAEEIPAVRQLRSIVRRACRARIISTKGRRRHG
jgi:hypothetical protein